MVIYTGAPYSVIVKQSEKFMNGKYVIKYVDRATNTLYLNSRSPYFENGVDTEGYKGSCKRNCSRCYGRGFEMWDQGAVELYMVVCRSLQSKLEKREKEVAEFN